MLFTKLREVFFSVLHVGLLVLLIHLFIEPLPTTPLIQFFVGLFFVFIGLFLFLLGVDVGNTTTGELFGSSIAKSGKIWIVVIAGIVLGFIISAAEPSVLILSQQVNQLTNGTISNAHLIIAVASFVGLFVMIGLLRIVFNFPLYILLAISYGLIFILAIFAGLEIVSIAFDASAATTGAMTVPFILAISVGITSIKKQSKSAEKDSFGLLGIASAGAILGVLILGLFADVSSDSVATPIIFAEGSIWELFLNGIPPVVLEVVLIVSPILLLFVIFQLLVFKLRKKRFFRILKGFIYIFIGLILFLLGVYQGFMQMGWVIAEALGSVSITMVIIVSFLLGFFSVIAEPSVYVLTHKIDEVTTGYVSSKLVLITLGLGVGIALVLNTLRIIIPGFLLWHILLVGYLIALALMWISPKLFVGIAFDAGGVASGPISATFIFAFSQGIAFSTDAQTSVADLFGLIAIVAMMPIVVIQVLGIVYKLKSKKQGIDQS